MLGFDGVGRGWTKGTLLFHTVIGFQPVGVDRQVPFTLGLIKFDRADTGFVCFVNETDLKKLRNGLRVEAVFKDQREGYVTDIDYCKVIWEES